MALDLDRRQRAMLEEMHVRVWWPKTEAPVVAREIADRPVTTAVAGAVIAPIAVQPQAQVAPMAPVNSALVQPTGAVDAMDWPTLARTISSCGACKLCLGRKAPVFNPEALPRQADWLVVGEPPDEQEERAGAPFAGPSGELLDNMLRAVFVARGGAGSAGARLTNVVKCRPAAVRNPQAEELATCAQYLRREIALVHPKVILAMGRFAAFSLLGTGNPELAKLPFGKLRGQVYRYQGVPVVVTYHPSRLLRAPQDKAAAWADLCLAQSTVARQASGQSAQ